MMQNPMVVQMQQMQARLDRKNEEVLREEAKDREQASEARQEHINALQGDRDTLAQELERLKAELALSQRGPAPAVAVAVATPTTGATPGRAPPKKAPKRAEFDGGRGQRKKKDSVAY